MNSRVEDILKPGLKSFSADHIIHTTKQRKDRSNCNLLQLQSQATINSLSVASRVFKTMIKQNSEPNPQSNKQTASVQ